MMEKIRRYRKIMQKIRKISTYKQPKNHKKQNEWTIPELCKLSQNKKY
jgi:hypothetical protein